MPSKCFPSDQLTEDKLINCRVWPPGKTDIQSGQAAFAVISAAVAAIPLNFSQNYTRHKLYHLGAGLGAILLQECRAPFSQHNTVHNHLVRESYVL